MNLQKHLPTFFSWYPYFSRKPKQAALPLKIHSVEPWPDPPIGTPATAKETPRMSDEAHIDRFITDSEPRKRTAYIPTNESPWAIIVWYQGKWEFYAIRPTRKEGRALVKQLEYRGKPARVVRVIVPTR